MNVNAILRYSRNPYINEVQSLRTIQKADQTDKKNDHCICINIYAAPKRAALFSLEASSVPKVISFFPEADTNGSAGVSSFFASLVPFWNLAARAALTSSLDTSFPLVADASLNLSARACFFSPSKALEVVVPNLSERALIFSTSTGTASIFFPFLPFTSFSTTPNLSCLFLMATSSLTMPNLAARCSLSTSVEVIPNLSARISFALLGASSSVASASSVLACLAAGSPSAGSLAGVFLAGAGVAAFGVAGFAGLSFFSSTAGTLGVAVARLRVSLRTCVLGVDG